MGNRRRAVGLAGALIAAVSLLPLPASAQASSATIVELRLDGVVDPFMANFVTGGIRRATDEGARAVLLTIDTPGGLGSSMREITQAILNADVPVIGYVSPAGARAASAGTFILLACNIAAMAPGTNVGAAHPVGISGAIESQKTTNDAAASIRSIAEERGRNASWAVSAVVDSVSASAQEALNDGVIDLIAPSTSALLSDVDGQTVTLGNGDTVTLDLAGATIRQEQMGIAARIFHALLDPNLIFIFFWLGLALVVLGFLHHPLDAIIGAVLLFASIIGLGLLPVQLIGVVLLIASVAFFVLELKHPGIGVPAIAGTVSLVLGGLFLFNSSVPSARVSPLVIVPTAAFAALFFLVVVRAALRMRNAGSQTRQANLVGAEGVVVRDLDPVGVVQVSSEEWSAEAVRGSPSKGERVRIVAMQGLRLKVEPVGEPAHAAPATADPEGRAT